MKRGKIYFSGKYSGGERFLCKLVGAGLVVVFASMLGSFAPAFAGNGLTQDVVRLLNAVGGAGGDFIIACPRVLAGRPDPDGTLDGRCGAAGEQPLFAGYGNADERRIRRGGGGLEENKTVRGNAFGDLMGTSSGDIVCWTFERTRRVPPSLSADVKVCARVLEGTGPSASSCGGSSELLVQQNAGVCSNVAMDLGLPENSLAYLFAANTSRLAQRGSATITRCSPDFVVQCVDPANMGLTNVTVLSTRPIDAYDGTYASRRLW